MNIFQHIKKKLASSKYPTVIVATIASSIFFLLGIVFQVSQHKTNLESNLKLRSELILKTIYQECKIDILLIDTLALQLKIKEYYKTDQDINGLSFYDSHGKLISGNIDSDPPKIFNRIFFKNLESGFITTIEITNEAGNRIGLISLSYRKDTIQKMVSNLTLKLVLLSTGFLLIICLSLIWMTRLINKATHKEAKISIDLKLAKSNSTMQKSFLANMSHELRTPLNAIIGFSKILNKSLKIKKNRTHNEYVLEASESMLVLINDILDFSKIEAGEMNLEPSHFDINQTLKIVCDSLIPKVPDSVYFEFNSFENKNNIVYADYHRIKQILINIINNAIKYTISGKIKVSHKCSIIKGKILFECSISDTGIGIDAAAITNIFTPFKQVHNKGSIKNIVGTGLGLSIVKTLVEKMEGSISCESIKGKGSTFTFQLLLASGDPKLIKLNPDWNYQLSSFKNKHHLLVAEDFKLNQLLIENTLKNVGITCDIVENGEEVLEKLQTQTYDLILMDIQMPIMGGVEATKIIRSGDNSYKDIPIIAVTANAIKGDKDYYLSSGMSGYVSKPINENELVSELNRYIE